MGIKSFTLAMVVPLVIVDQLTKYIAFKEIDPFSPVRILPFLQLVNVKNTGAAFGLFQNLGNMTFLIITLFAVVLILMIWIKTKEDRFALTFILSGAIGNLLDRLMFGYVRDFIDIHVGKYHWPAFNLADSFLTVGVFFMFLRLFRTVRE